MTKTEQIERALVEGTWVEPQDINYLVAKLKKSKTKRMLEVIHIGELRIELDITLDDR
jgi:hypothetical protein